MRALSAGELRFAPLGGLGQVGMNCMALEQAGGTLLIDCGTSFPEDDYGVDVIHPDFSWLSLRGQPLVGVFLTHGHEDHVGGLPYLLRHHRIPVWGPPHALGMALYRLREHGYSEAELDLRPVQVRRPVEVGPFQVEPIRVTHSITDATALAIRTAAGLVLHSGDFKLDPHPTDGELTDTERLQELGVEGVRLLMSDSTNIDTEGHTTSEAVVAERLRAWIGSSKERVVVGLFASNIQRLSSIGAIARATGRRICLLGRSLNVQQEVAGRIGRLGWPSDLMVSPEQAQGFPRGSLLVLAGGTQGEPGSSLYRLSRGEHHQLKLAPGDRVILSSRVIPGNERRVSRMHDDFLRQELDLVTYRDDRGVHASGHAAREEQTELIELVSPQAFMPVHGTLHHLKRHAELARSLGVSEQVVIENGQSAVLTKSSLRADETFPSGSVSVAYGGAELTAETLRRRRELGRAGVVFLHAVARGGREPTLKLSVSAHGVPGLDGVTPELATLHRELLVEYPRLRRRGELTEELKRAARRVCYRRLGVRPHVELQLEEES